MIQNERRKKLLESMKKINKNFKDSVMDFADNLDDAEMIPSGINQIDKFTGGLKRGNFTVIWGGEGVGKSTLALQNVANCQKAGQIACYIDMERSFDAIRAKQLDVNLEELILVSKCQTAEHALEIVRSLSKDKAVDLIILDSIQSMSPIGEQENKGKERGLASKEMAELARTLSKFFRVVAPDVYRAKIACLLIGQVRMNLGSFIVRAGLSGGKALHHWAYQNIFMRRGQKADNPVKKFKEYFFDSDNKLRYETKNLNIGFDTVLKLCKTKSSLSAIENSEIHIPFLYDKGFVDKIEESEEIPIRIDPNASEEDKVEIEKVLIEKGILPKKDNSSVEKEPDQIVQNDVKLEDKPVKKKRGRPKNEKN